MKKKDQGFTLIELLISVFVLSIVLLAISSMVYSVMRANTQSKGTTTALTLLQDKSETLKNIRYASLSNGNDSSTLGNISYNRQWTVSTSGNVKTINITVNWNDRIPRSVTATTFRGE